MRQKDSEHRKSVGMKMELEKKAGERKKRWRMTEIIAQETTNERMRHKQNEEQNEEKKRQEGNMKVGEC